MFIESESGNEGRAATVSPFMSDQAVGNRSIDSIQAAIDSLKRADGASHSLLRAAARAVAFSAGRTAKGALPGIDAPPVAGGASRLHTGGMGLLSLAALTFSSVKDAHAADAGVTSLDEDSIDYKDLPHGSFELVTKEAIPRYILVEDPGQTVVLNKVGTTIGVNQFTNSAARMDELQLAQQEVQANWAKGLGHAGSGTTPFSDTLPVQPINFTEPEGPAGLNSLPVLPAVELKTEFIFIPPPPPAPTILTLNLGLGPTEIDTVVFDTFSATSGTFGASSSNGSTPLTYGISGGTVGNTVVGGVTYNVSEAGAFGTLYVNSSTGAYTFVPNDAAINALKAPTTENFVITVSDGTASASQTFSIDINGVNDEATIAGDETGSIGGAPAASAARFAAALAPAPHVATGTLTSADVDDPANTFAAVTSPTASDGGYGTFTMTAGGKWTYTLDDNNGTVKALNVGDTLTDTFTVTSIDGTQQVIKIVIDGWNDPAVISGDTTGCVVEAACKDPGIPIATGTLTATDVDNPSDLFTPVKCGHSDCGYGTFTMTADGVWTYKLDNDNCAVQALNKCDTLTDTFTVTSIDGTEQVVTITIAGTNDAAIICGTTTGKVVEAACEDPGKPTATGTLADKDVDNPDNTFTPVKCEKSDGGYGTFTMTADGKWTYTLDNDNCKVQALDDCDTLTDTFTVTSVDGTEQVITITIHGADDEHHHEDSDEKWTHETSASSNAAAASGSDSVAGKDSAGVATIPADTKAAATSSPAAAPDAGESFQFKDQGSGSPAPESVTSADGGKTSVSCSVEIHETSGTAVVVNAVVANVSESCSVHDVSEDFNASAQKWAACHTAHDLVA
jgi:VCBS repeat-containing protein